MKEGIFISYSDFDKDKVELINKELEGNLKFYPIIIASNREALKPLAKKVVEGILQAKIIVPILTSQSIVTQWINQEIGFASALDKRIMPIVELNIIDNLKGFIHKQIDLPYSFRKNTDSSVETEDFVRQVRNLISDLEQEFTALSTVEINPVKSEFEISLDEVDKANAELDFQRNRLQYISSYKAVEDARTFVFNLFSDIDNKINILKDKNIHVGIEKEVYEPVFILKCEKHSLSFAWQHQYHDSNEGAFLLVRRWKGYITNKPGAGYFPHENPECIWNEKYSFELNRKGEQCWLNVDDNSCQSNVDIVDRNIKWLIEQVTQIRLSRGTNS